MQLKYLSRKSVIIVSLCILAIAAGFGFNILTRKPGVKVTDFESHSGLPLVHAQSGSGCAKCHTQPLTGDCSDCHGAPPQSLGEGVTFPHHDDASGGPPDNCGSSSCHNASNDIRFVDTPNASHSYCDDCHSSDIEHS